MRVRINDGLPNSMGRQRRWQIRKNRQGLCIICGKRQTKGDYCTKHYDANREESRRRRRRISLLDT